MDLANDIVNSDIDEKIYEKINIDKYFGENGVIHKKFEKFETRNEQYEMAKSVENILNENKKLIVEAGTGTGKTIAYLLPSILYSVENDLKMIVSTNTINLQEQLINKDIPLLEKIVENGFKYVIVKGRGNYLCKRKLYNINTMENEKDSEEEKTEKLIVKNLEEWDNFSKTGDKNELKYEISYKIWEKVNCESDMCTGAKCPYYSDCYFFKARREISTANMLIVNHHMFFADLSIRNEVGFETDYAILPNYDIVVFDEAHNIEDTARSYFSYEISKYSFGRLLGNIHNRRTINSNNSGAFTKMLIYLNQELAQEQYVKIDDMKDEIITGLNTFYDKGNEIFDKLITPFTERMLNGETKVRIDSEKVKKSKYWKDILEIKQKFTEIYGNLLLSITKFLNVVSDFELDDKEGIIFDFTKYFDRLKQYFKRFEFIISTEDETYVYWLAVNPTKASIKLYATPFDVSYELRENLFNKMERMIFTSATLAVEDKFEYYRESVGLTGKNIDEKIINSSFDYEKQMKVYIPNDTLDPNNIEFLDDSLEFIEKSIKATKGHCFLLFTSYSSMNYLYNKLKIEFNKREYTLIKQSDYPRHEMIEIFKKSKNPILFGTDSFWEGVDVQGEQLKSVIIVKLPFKVPNDPITEAIIENIKNSGKIPFIEYQVPQAVIKFKQGIGRLIRSKEDSGNIIILDNRVIKKNYGEKFLKSLPKNIVNKSRKEILKIMEAE